METIQPPNPIHPLLIYPEILELMCYNHFSQYELTKLRFIKKLALLSKDFRYYVSTRSWSHVWFRVNQPGPTYLVSASCFSIPDLSVLSNVNLSSIRKIDIYYRLKDWRVIHTDYFSQLTRLQKLKFRNAAILIGNIHLPTSLQSLYVGAEYCSTRNFESCLTMEPIISNLQNLTKLVYTKPYDGITDNALSRMTGLKHLRIKSTDGLITDDSIACLTNLTRLVSTGRESISDASLSKLTRLKYLKIGSRNITDASIRCLTNLSHLEFDSYNSVSDKSINELMKLTYLSYCGRVVGVDIAGSWMLSYLKN